MFEGRQPVLMDQQLQKTVQYNCDISDARDHGIYSMCSMVLKLRNLYKWEQGLEPWQEPEPPDLLDWIDRKEANWEGLGGEDFKTLDTKDNAVSPFDVETVNEWLVGSRFVYGAGYGRSMKAIFFLAEERDRRVTEGCPVILLGTESARDMAAPFAMCQDGQIIIRLEPLRYFLWDHIQELRSSCKSSYLFTLNSYGLLKGGVLDQQKFRQCLGDIVRQELDVFIYHEIGELQETVLDSASARTVISRFPDSVIEFVCRAVKDVLADTHPCGVLSHICRNRRTSSLGLYVSFLDGLRQELFPEMADGWKCFLRDNDWQCVEAARDCCRQRLLGIADAIAGIAALADESSDEVIIRRFNDAVLIPLGLEMPVTAGGAIES